MPSIEIKPDMKVVGCDGGEIGRVDHAEHDRIELVSPDKALGQHHYIALGSVDHIDDKVHLVSPARRHAE